MCQADNGEDTAGAGIDVVPYIIIVYSYVHNTLWRCGNIISLPIKSALLFISIFILVKMHAFP